MTLLAQLAAEIPRTEILRSAGRVVAVRGPVIFARVPHAAIGDLCIIERRDGSSIRAQVVSFSRREICLAPFEDIDGIAPGAEVQSTGAPLQLEISDEIIGTVVNCFGEAISRNAAPYAKVISRTSYSQPPPAPLERPIIAETLECGIAALDGLCTIGYGQRIGLFAGAGVGKSTLLGMIARNAKVDLSVIALIGERGREVREFLEQNLGDAGMRRAVLVVASSEESPIRRALAIESATAIAEHFRRRGKRVLLLADSLTRAARALREVGLAAGELPIRQGYTPSVYTKLPKILERAGTTRHGSITAIYTVLTNGEGESDPLGEEIKSLLDGHIVLDSRVAERGIRPAIDVSVSISRLMARLQTPEHLRVADTIRTIIARLKRDKDLLLFGGTPDRELAAAIACEVALKKVLSQSPDEFRPRAETECKLREIAESFRKTVSA